MSGIAASRREAAAAFTAALLLHAAVLLLPWPEAHERIRVPPIELLLAAVGPEPLAPERREASEPEASKAENARVPATTLPPKLESKSRSVEAPAARSATRRSPAGKKQTVKAAPQSASVKSTSVPPPRLATAGPRAAELRARYEQVLAAWIDRYKVYPDLARRRRFEGRGLLRVQIARDGTLVSERLDRSTDHAVLDRAARETVQRAAPFPPVPDELAGARYEFVVPFVFELAGR